MPKTTCLLLAGFLLGCCDDGSTPTGDVESRIGKCVEFAANRAKSGNPVRECSLSTASAIYALSNDVRQVECFKKWADRLLAYDTSQFGYVEREAYIRSVQTMFLTSILGGLVWSHADPELVFAVRLELIGWLQDQFAQVRPRNRRVSVGGKPDKAYLDWKWCYQSAYDCHRRAIEQLEDHDFPRETKGLPEGKRLAVKQMIEKRLGRPMRSRDEIRASRGQDSEEYKAVMADELAP